MSRYPTVPGLLPREEVDSYSQLVSAPGPYLEFGEFLYLEATSTDASATLRFSGKFLSTDGEIRAFSEDMVITGTGVQTAVTSRIGPCWLMGFAVRVVAGTITDGEIVCSVHVARAGASTPVHVMTLASGEVTNTRALGLGAFLALGAASASEQPTMVAATATNPAAGAQQTWTVPAGQVWQVQSIYGQLVTSAVAFNRRAGVLITDGTNSLARAYNEINQTASVTFVYTMALGVEHFQTTAGNNRALPLPAVLIGTGWTIGTTVDGMQAGDQWSSLAISYRQY